MLFECVIASPIGPAKDDGFCNPKFREEPLCGRLYYKNIRSAIKMVFLHPLVEPVLTVKSKWTF